jgi:hypothetical protein
MVIHTGAVVETKRRVAERSATAPTARAKAAFPVVMSHGSSSVGIIAEAGAEVRDQRSEVRGQPVRLSTDF